MVLVIDKDHSPPCHSMCFGVESTTCSRTLVLAIAAGRAQIRDNYSISNDVNPNTLFAHFVVSHQAMATFSDSPTKPSALSTSDPEAGLSYAEPNPAHDAGHKRPLNTWADVKTEWQIGSQKRVIKHYAISLLIGLLVGGIIGMAIGLAVRYTVGKH